jgi:hypothetical protein
MCLSGIDYYTYVTEHYVLVSNIRSHLIGIKIDTLLRNLKFHQSMKGTTIQPLTLQQTDFD